MWAIKDIRKAHSYIITTLRKRGHFFLVFQVQIKVGFIKCFKFNQNGVIINVITVAEFQGGIIKVKWLLGSNLKNFNKTTVSMISKESSISTVQLLSFTP